MDNAIMFKEKMSELINSSARTGRLIALVVAAFCFSGNALAQNQAVSDSYELQAGDVISIQVFDEPDLSGAVGRN